MKRVLITGSTGFIGSSLTSDLLNNYEVIVILRKKKQENKSTFKKKKYNFLQKFFRFK